MVSWGILGPKKGVANQGDINESSKEEKDMPQIKHIAIATQDADATAKFYVEVFGLREIAKLDSENASGYYLSDGSINIAILRFKNDVLVGDKFDINYSGIHHIGFQVDDAEAADSRLRKADAYPMEEINTTLHAGMGRGHGGKNVELKYNGPDGVIIDISQTGWVGTEEE